MANKVFAFDEPKIFANKIKKNSTDLLFIEL